MNALSMLAVHASFLFPGAQTATGPLSVDEAIAIAQRDAFSVLIQQVALEQARARIDQAQTGFRPRVSSSVTYTRFDEAQSASFGPGQSVVTQPIDQRTIAASVQWTLDINGQLRRQLSSARLSAKASEFQVASVLNDIRLNTRLAYFNVIRAQLALVVQQQALELAKARLAQTRQQFDQDQVARIDVTRFETQVQASEAEVLAAENQVQLAKNALNQILGRAIDTSFETADVPSMPSVAINNEALTKLALETRPDVSSLRTTLRALAENRRAVEAGNRPSLSAGFNYQRLFGEVGAFARESQWTANLTLSIPLYDQGVTRAQVNVLKKDEATLDLQIKQLELSIAAAVRDATLNLSNAEKRLVAAQEQVRLAEETFRIATVRRDAGEGTYVEVIDAITSLTQARTQLVNTRFDYLTAYSQLQRALGRDDIPATAPTTENK